MSQEKVPVSRIVEAIVRSDPCLQSMLEKGLLNLSKTAEWITNTLENSHHYITPEAVKTALSRLKRRLTGENTGPVRAAELLTKSSLELRGDVAVITYPLTALKQLASIVSKLAGSSRILLLFQGVTTITLTIGEEHADQVLEEISVEPVYASRKRSLLIIISPIEIINTKGFLSHITTILANTGINIEQAMSVHTDTVLVLSPEDAEKAYKTLTTIKRIHQSSLNG